MSDNNELRLRSGRVLRRYVPYEPHRNLLQSQQNEQERRRFAATITYDSNNSDSGSNYTAEDYRRNGQDYYEYIIYVIQNRIAYMEMAANRCVPSHLINKPALIRRLTRMTEADLAFSRARHNCVICQDRIVAQEKLRVLPCKHAFHLPCIDKWFETSYECPICRFSLLSQMTTFYPNINQDDENNVVGADSLEEEDPPEDASANLPLNDADEN